MRRLLIVLCLIALPCLAIAAGTSSTSTSAITSDSVTSDNVVDIVSTMALAFSKRSWALGAGLLLTLIAAWLRAFNFAQKIPVEWMPWAVLGMAMLASIGVGLQSGKRFSTILIGGLSVGVMAIGGWETIGKMVRALIEKLRHKPTPTPNSSPEGKQG